MRRCPCRKCVERRRSCECHICVAARRMGIDVAPTLEQAPSELQLLRPSTQSTVEPITEPTSQQATHPTTLLVTQPQTASSVISAIHDVAHVVVAPTSNPATSTSTTVVMGLNEDSTTIQPPVALHLVTKRKRKRRNDRRWPLQFICALMSVLHVQEYSSGVYMWCGC